MVDKYLPVSSARRNFQEDDGDVGEAPVRQNLTPARSAGTDQDDDDIAPAVGANLRRLRSKRGLSLERLAQRASVSRAMLGQIELGHSVPTINLLWKIARALDVPFSALLARPSPGSARVLSAAGAKLLTNQAGTFTSRALFPLDESHRTEFYELRLKARGEEAAGAHAPGTLENLVVTAGTVEISVNRVVHRLNRSDAILFSADVPHRYRNPGDVDATMYLVMTYAETRGEPGRIE